jgi:hypothetical protein
LTPDTTKKNKLIFSNIPLGKQGKSVASIRRISKIMMASQQREDIASKLLHSTDSRIAEAAKRVFSSNAALPPAVVAGLAPPPSSSTGAGVESDEGAMIRAPPPVDEYDAMLPPSGGRNAEEFGRQGAALAARANRDEGGGDADSVGSNDGDAEDLDGCGKKPSSTDRLKRR